MHAAKAALAAWCCELRERWFQPVLPPQSMAALKAGLKLSLLTVIAFSLALFTAFEAEINEAGLSGMTAAVLSLPAVGAAFAKSYARIAGCVMSALACVALFWVFPQAPWLFAAGLSLWIGFCAFWGSKIKFFASYAFILAGWSAAIIATDAQHNAELAIVIAGERLSVFIIGILAVMFVFGIAHIRKGFAAYLPPLKEMNDRIVSQIKALMSNPESYDNTLTMMQWAKDINAIHQSMAYASAEDPEVALHAKSIRCGLNAMFADLSDFLVRLQQIQILLRASPDQALTKQVDQAILAAFDARLQETDAQSIERIRRMQAMVLNNNVDTCDPDLKNQTLLLAEIDAAGKLINTMNLVRRGREMVIEQNIRPLGRATTFGDSLYIASVAAFTFMVAHGIYVVNEWLPAGQLFIVFVTIYILTAAVTDDPVEKVKKMVPGVACGFIAALVCQQVLLPLGSGFPWLVLCFSVTILIPGAILRALPRTTEAASAFVQAGMILAMPQNLMNYNLQAFLNGGLACASAFMLVWGVVWVFFPGGYKEKCQKIQRQATCELLQIPSHLRADRFSLWEDRQLERLSIVSDFSDAKETAESHSVIQKLLIMIRLARSFKRQYDDLHGLKLSPDTERLLEQASWFWPRQLSSPERFCLVAGRVVDALVADAASQPGHAPELLSAAHDWRMILQNRPLIV